MTNNEYQKFAAQGIRPESEGKEQLFHFALGLAGETGEVCDAIKKREFHGRDIPIEHIKEELGDVMWYVANLCNKFNLQLDDVLESNVKKLKMRYPELYSEEELYQGVIITNDGCKVKFKCNGPHIEMVDAASGKHIKFISKEEYNYYVSIEESLPF